MQQRSAPSLTLLVFATHFVPAATCECSGVRGSPFEEDYRVSGTSPLVPGPGHFCSFHHFGLNSSCGCGSAQLITGCRGPKKEHDSIMFWHAVGGNSEPGTKLHNGCFRHGLTCVMNCPEGLEVDGDGVCWPLNASTVAFDAAAGGERQHQWRYIEAGKPGDYFNVTFPSNPYSWIDTSDWTVVSKVVETRDESRNGTLFKYRILPTAIPGSVVNLTWSFEGATGYATLWITIANQTVSRGHPGQSSENSNLHNPGLRSDGLRSAFGAPATSSCSEEQQCSTLRPCPPPPPSAGPTVHNECVFVEKGQQLPSCCGLTCMPDASQDCPTGTDCRAVAGVGICVNTTNQSPDIHASVVI